MGCLKFIIRVTIVVFAIIGFKSIGGFDFIKNLHFFEKPSRETMIEKSKIVADFSNIPDEYEIDRTADILGYKGVLAEHKASGQKFAVLNPNEKVLLSKKDFEDGSVKKKIADLNEKLEYQYIRLENFKIIKQGKFNSMGQSVPYVRYEAEVTNLPVKKIEGIIGVAEYSDSAENNPAESQDKNDKSALNDKNNKNNSIVKSDKNNKEDKNAKNDKNDKNSKNGKGQSNVKSKILISAAQAGKYSQIITEEFFNNVK